jgi:hypothetical protein
MPKRKRRLPTPLPLLFAELAFASWETMARRWLMIAGGTCSPAEYTRMVLEKAAAAQRSARALSRKRSRHDVGNAMRPWHRAATANARRLRKR